MPGKVLNSDRKHIQKDHNHHVVTILYALEYYIFLNCILFAFSFTLFMFNVALCLLFRRRPSPLITKPMNRWRNLKGPHPRHDKKLRKRAKRSARVCVGLCLVTCMCGGGGGCPQHVFFLFRKTILVLCIGIHQFSCCSYETLLAFVIS